MQHLILTDAKTKTAFHYCGQPTLLQHVLDCLERHPNLGSHVFSTSNPSWDSVVAYDSYFKDYTPYGAISDTEPKFNLIRFERNLK